MRERERERERESERERERERESKKRENKVQGAISKSVNACMYLYWFNTNNIMIKPQEIIPSKHGSSMQAMNNNVPNSSLLNV